MKDNVTLCSLRDREVISVCDGKRLGYVCDAEIDLSCGKVCALIIPGDMKLLGFSRSGDYYVPWDCIQRIGDDVILVNAEYVYKKDKDKKKK